MQLGLLYRVVADPAHAKRDASAQLNFVQNQASGGIISHGLISCGGTTG